MKSIVVAVNGKRCTVLKKNGEFSEITNRGYTVGQQIDLPSAAHLRRALSAAACFVLLAVGLYGRYAALHTPVSYVYLDINPSIRLDLNREESVLSVVPLNADAEQLLSNTAIHSESVTDCIQQIVTLCNEQNYLNSENRDIDLSVMTNQKDLMATIQSASTVLEEQTLLVSVYTVGQTENRYAVERNLSAKDVRAVEQYTACFGGDVQQNLQMLEEKSADTLLEEVRAHRRSTKGADMPSKPPVSESDKNGRKTSTRADSFESGTVSHISEKRLRALERYAACFGMTTEEATELLRGVSTKTILGEIWETAGESDGAASADLSHDPAEKGYSAQRSECRQKALEAYTAYFGGTLEENSAALSDFSISEIYAAIRQARKNSLQ